jgi:hypothetical protein
MDTQDPQTLLISNPRLSEINYAQMQAIMGIANQPESALQHGVDSALQYIADALNGKCRATSAQNQAAKILLDFAVKLKSLQNQQVTNF